MNDQEIEKKIVTMIVDDALAQGYAVSVYNGGDSSEIYRSVDKDAILAACFASDSDRLLFVRRGLGLGWVEARLRQRLLRDFRLRRQRGDQRHPGPRQRLLR
jgi:hypothetical protein